MCAFWKNGGKSAYHHHEDYHKQMTQAIVDKLDESEIPVLLKTLDALTGFFTDYTRESKEKFVRQYG